MPRTALRRRMLGVSLLIALAAQIHPAPGLTAAVGPATPVAAAGDLAATTPLDGDLANALTDALGRARRASRAPGLSLAVLGADGRQYLGVSGTHSNGAPLDASDPMRIGSVTKTFTAAIILALAEEGRIHLDNRADRYLPKVKLVRQVTIRQLLNHTSGIQDLYGPAKRFLGGKAGRTLSSNDVLRPLKSNKAPGRHYKYSNTNYYLLGLIIEKVTGHSFNAEIKARYTDRFGFEVTHLVTQNDALLPPAWRSAFWTSGAMVSTPSELTRWGRALYGGGLLSKGSRQAMLNFKSGHAYGLGAQLMALGTYWVPGHSGLLYDTTSLLVYLPKEKVTIAIIGTAPNTDLGHALTRRYGGGPSILELAKRLAG